MKNKGRFKGRKQARKETKARKMRVLDKYDTENYCRDLEYLGRLSFLRESTRMWIEDRMYELRESANRYEQFVGQLLMKMGYEFIHQAPFVFRPHSIYFCDFYIPLKRVVIEVDGVYHNSSLMVCKDEERDANFKSVGIRVIRVANSEALDTAKLRTRLENLIGPVVKYEEV